MKRGLLLEYGETFCDAYKQMNDTLFRQRITAGTATDI